MVNKLFLKIPSCLLFVALLFLYSCKNAVNSVNDPHFSEEGYSLDTLKDSFVSVAPNTLRFYVEVSGSMNGFFRSNKATRFKKDVWSIVSNFGNSDVYVLSNAGTVAGVYGIDAFRSRMNSGGFVSNHETLVPTMLKSILDNLNYNDNECAVLISDMKYSPERQRDVQVLLTQYQSDIRNVIGSYPGLAVSLLMANSDYLSARGLPITENSPYYYLILGKDTNVAYMRNCIATLLDSNGDYGDCVESGFNYKSPSYSFGIPNNALQMFDQPTFINYDTQYSDTCKIVLNIDLSDYRWLIAEESVFRKCFVVKSTYGSEVKVGNISISVDNHFERKLKRKATAQVELLVSNMYTDSDVIEFSLDQPDYSVTSEFTSIMSATAENDYTGSFSVDRFVAGVFNAIQNSWDESPNRILISKTK